jgi:AhpC/TSA family
MTDLWLASYIALWFLVLLLALCLIAVLHNLGAIYSHIRQGRSLGSAPSKLETGSVVPNVRWQTVDGQEQSVWQLKGAKRAFILISPTCNGCKHYLQELGRGDQSPDPLDETIEQMVIVGLTDREETLQMLQAAAIPPNGRTTSIVIDSKHEVMAQWGISALPATVIVDEQLRVVRQVFGGGAASQT